MNLVNNTLNTYAGTLNIKGIYNIVVHTPKLLMVKVAFTNIASRITKRFCRDSYPMLETSKIQIM